MHLCVQSCLNFFPVACFVVQCRHSGRSQSFPCQGSDLCKRSTSFVPVFSTTLNFIPVCLPSSFSASLYLLANSPSIVKGTKKYSYCPLFSAFLFLYLPLFGALFSLLLESNSSGFLLFFSLNQLSFPVSLPRTLVRVLQLGGVVFYHLLNFPTQLR